MAAPEEIVDFWREAGKQAWFSSDPAFDREIEARFGAAHHAAARRELDAWSASWTGALALLLLLDQFPRNIFRGSAHAFATDPLALRVADQAVAAGLDRQAPPELRTFFYLAFEHAEDLAHQDRAMGLYEALGEPESLDWAERHREVIVRFGRFPHRNAALGRDTTPEEQTYLEAGGGF